MAVHHLHQLSGDGQTQARAAVPAGVGLVYLGEALEDGLEFVFRDADARVRDGKMQKDGIFAFLVGDDSGVGKFNGKDDLSALGEFDGVAQKVDEYLPEPSLIALQINGNVPFDVMDEFRFFLVGLDGQGADGGFHQDAEVEVGFVQLHLSGFDLGEVEDVVEQGKQGVCRLAAQGHVLLLLGCQIGVQGQVGPTGVAHVDRGVMAGGELLVRGMFDRIAVRRPRAPFLLEVRHLRNGLHRVVRGEVVEGVGLGHVAVGQVGEHLRLGRIRAKAEVLDRF